MNDSRRNRWTQILCGPPLSRSANTYEHATAPHAPWNFDDLEKRYPKPGGVKQEEGLVEQDCRNEPANGQYAAHQAQV